MGVFGRSGKRVETSPVIGDTVATTTCYMCACRCGIKVHLRDGRVRFIEGNRAHPVNGGVLCAKGSAGIMTQYSPARLTRPLVRVGARGAGEFREVDWGEAMTLAATWLSEIRRSNPRKLAFFTGRDQSQALTGWWAQQFGTPNYAAHGGFCSVNMAAAGLYSVGGSFWEFGEPDWEHTRYLMLFGVAEDHSSNPMKIGLGKLKSRSADRRAKILSINPVKTGYSAIADEWLGIRPGTDGLLVLALIHELLRADRVDLAFLVRYTNAPWLVIQAPGTAQDGLIARDARGQPLCWDKARSAPASALLPDIVPALIGEFTLLDGRRAVPVFQLMAARYLEPRYAPEAVAAECGIPASAIRRIAAEIAHAAFAQEVVLDVPWTDWAGRRHEKMVGRPVSMHAMRGIAAHSNGFHTCRAIHLLQMLVGSIDSPGGFRYRPPYPRPVPPRQRPAGRMHEVTPLQPLPGPPLGFPTGPEQLLVEADGTPRRIDKAFSWEAPLGIHGALHTVIGNAWRGDPYPIDTLLLYMANMGWNSSMGTGETLEMLADWNSAAGSYRIPHVIYADAFYSEMVPYADLVLPDTTYLERWDCISLADRPISDADGAADAIRQPVVAADRDVRPFQEVLIDLGTRLQLPGLVTPEGAPRYPGGYADYITNFERKPGFGLLAGWRGPEGKGQGKGAPNPEQLTRYRENGCFWRVPLADNQKYFKHANRAYLDWAASMGFLDRSEQIVLQIYSEPLQRFRLAARGHGPMQPPERHRERVERYFDPLPFWYAPLEESAIRAINFPLHAITQRPMAQYHSWGSHNAWLRQIHGRNWLYINTRTAQMMGLDDDDWVWVVSHHGRMKLPVRLMEGVNPDTVWTWNAIGKRRGAWNLSPDAPEARQGFIINHLISERLPAKGDAYRYSNSDPVTGQAAWYDLRVRLERVAPEEAREPSPQLEPLTPPVSIGAAPTLLRYGAAFRGRAGDDWAGNGPEGRIEPPRAKRRGWLR
jgi:anaerobic selenocysteine-containing dehydrogenase